MHLKQGRNIAEFDQDEGISFVQEDVETQGRYDHDIEVNTVSASITNAGVSISTVEPNQKEACIMKEASKITSRTIVLLNNNMGVNSEAVEEIKVRQKEVRSEQRKELDVNAKRMLSRGQK
ncbi:hypothetical protein Tco_0409194 [Tanacetum coccineum]